MEKEKSSTYVAKMYFALFEQIQKNQNNSLNKLDIISKLRESYEHLYIFNGRYLTEEEIIVYEINQIQTYLISDDFENCTYKDDIKKYYTGLIKVKMAFKQENTNKYKSYINIIYCLLNKTPPFLDIVYEKCLNIKNGKEKILKK